MFYLMNANTSKKKRKTNKQEKMKDKRSKHVYLRTFFQVNIRYEDLFEVYIM